jgi:hypothetical protein
MPAAVCKLKHYWHWQCHCKALPVDVVPDCVYSVDVASGSEGCCCNPTMPCKACCMVRIQIPRLHCSCCSCICQLMPAHAGFLRLSGVQHQVWVTLSEHDAVSQPGWGSTVYSSGCTVAVTIALWLRRPHKMCSEHVTHLHCQQLPIVQAACCCHPVCSCLLRVEVHLQAHRRCPTHSLLRSLRHPRPCVKVLLVALLSTRFMQYVLCSVPTLPHKSLSDQQPAAQLLAPLQMAPPPSS